MHAKVIPINPTLSQLNALTSKIDASNGPGACWEWRGTLVKRYGVLQVDKKRHKAHRLALVWLGGERDSSNGVLSVLHSCDNPKCCNPEHLRFGTHQENMVEMKRRNRSNFVIALNTPSRVKNIPRGDEHYSRAHPEKLARGDDHGMRKNPSRASRGSHRYNAVLTEDLVRDIKQRITKGEKRSEIALALGVKPRSITNVLSGGWKHVPWPEGSPLPLKESNE